jgi:hypothetical protein
MTKFEVYLRIPMTHLYMLFQFYTCILGKILKFQPVAVALKLW